MYFQPLLATQIGVIKHLENYEPAGIEGSFFKAVQWDNWHHFSLTEIDCRRSSSVLFEGAIKHRVCFVNHQVQDKSQKNKRSKYKTALNLLLKTPCDKHKTLKPLGICNDSFGHFFWLNLGVRTCETHQCRGVAWFFCLGTHKKLEGKRAPKARGARRDFYKPKHKKC